jgi:hypothetical protein
LGPGLGIILGEGEERAFAMKARWFLFPVACFVLLAFRATPARSQTLVTFEDLSAAPPGNIPKGYEGLTWSNLWVLNAILWADGGAGTNGYYYGMVSPSNVAFNAGGQPAEIDSATSFNFFSAYLTGAWNSNLNIDVQGFRNGTLIYDQTVVAAATNATLFTFNYMDIDRLYFDSYGGQPAGFPNGGGVIFAMDNFTFDFIPEPSSLLLASVGALLLWPLLKRRRG